MADKVRAKVQVNSIEHFAHGQRRVKATPVYGSAGENADYAKATPSGSIELTIDSSTPAIEFFEVGKQYYVDFTPAE